MNYLDSITNYMAQRTNHEKAKGRTLPAECYAVGARWLSYKIYEYLELFSTHKFETNYSVYSDEQWYVCVDVSSVDVSNFNEKFLHVTYVNFETVKVTMKKDEETYIKDKIYNSFDAFKSDFEDFVKL